MYDEETGFYYVSSRYYDPKIGRFLNADEIVSTGTGLSGFNMFAYCNNNPVMYADYEGNCPATNAEIKYYIVNTLKCDYCKKMHNAIDSLKARRNEFWGGKVMPVQGAQKINYNDYPNYEYYLDVPHRGTDIIYNGCYGAKVFSATPGEVVDIYTKINCNTQGNSNYVGNDTYGLCVKIKYGDVIIIYAHLSAICVEKGQQVEPWDLIGYVGDTGNASDPHLHFEVNQGGVPISPYPYLP